MRVLFWNTHNAKLNGLIGSAVETMDVDLLVLAEYKDNSDELCQTTGMQKYLSIGCEKITLFGYRDDVSMGEQHNRYSIQIVGSQYILCGVHLPSRMYEGHQGRRNIVIQQIVKALTDCETNIGTKNTIIVGDFNEDPYEEGCISADKFFGLPFISAKDTKRIEGVEYEKFYNPMWNEFGDFSGPPGTYYYEESNPSGTYWHIYDQVIIRPCLKNSFIQDSFKILTTIGATNLLTQKGIPNAEISDHLPVFFEIREE